MVVIPGGVSDWECVKAGVPQGSILGPLLFLLYINDIVENINSCVRLFADDISLYIIVDNPNNAANILNSDLSIIHKWAETWLVKFNPSKSESFLVSRKINRLHHPPLIMNNQYISEVSYHKHLGLFLKRWFLARAYKLHNIIGMAAYIYIMRKLKFLLDRDSLIRIYISFIRSVLEYADVVWDNCTQYEITAPEKIQLEAARIVTGATKLVALEMLNRETGCESLQERRRKHKMCLFYKMASGLTPSNLSDLVPLTVENTISYKLRDSHNIRPIQTRTQLYYKSFLPSSIRDWNDLPLTARNSASLSQLNKDKMKVPKYYNVGKRTLQIYHLRLRTNCSCLNFHLYSKNIAESPSCVCGDVESANHFLLQCPRFQQMRLDMMNIISTISEPSLNTLLYGDENLDNHANEVIFLTVQQFISQIKRFSTQ